MPNPATAASTTPTTAETSGGAPGLTPMSGVGDRRPPDDAGASTPRSPSHGHSAYPTTAATASRITTAPTVAAAEAGRPSRGVQRTRSPLNATSRTATTPRAAT